MIKLRAIEREDLPAMKRWRNDIIDVVREYRLINDEFQEQWWQGYNKQLATNYPKNLMYSIVSEIIDNEMLLGICGLTNIDWLNRRAELSFYIGTEYQNKLYGKDGLKALHDIAFNQLNLETIWLHLHEWNPRARKFVENAGYKLVGKFRNARFKEGFAFPTWIYDLTAEDYRNGSVDSTR